MILDSRDGMSYDAEVVLALQSESVERAYDAPKRYADAPTVPAGLARDGWHLHDSSSFREGVAA